MSEVVFQHPLLHVLYPGEYTTTLDANDTSPLPQWVEDVLNFLMDDANADFLSAKNTVEISIQLDGFLMRHAWNQPRLDTVSGIFAKQFEHFLSLSVVTKQFVRRITTELENLTVGKGTFQSHALVRDYITYSQSSRVLTAWTEVSTDKSLLGTFRRFIPGMKKLPTLTIKPNEKFSDTRPEIWSSIVAAIRAKGTKISNNAKAILNALMAADSRESLCYMMEANIEYVFNTMVYPDYFHGISFADANDITGTLYDDEFRNEYSAFSLALPLTVQLLANASSFDKQTIESEWDVLLDGFSAYRMLYYAPMQWMFRNSQLLMHSILDDITLRNHTVSMLPVLRKVQANLAERKYNATDPNRPTVINVFRDDPFILPFNWLERFVYQITAPQLLNYIDYVNRGAFPRGMRFMLPTDGINPLYTDSIVSEEVQKQFVQIHRALRNIMFEVWLKWFHRAPDAQFASDMLTSAQEIYRIQEQNISQLLPANLFTDTMRRAHIDDTALAEVTPIPLSPPSQGALSLPTTQEADPDVLPPPSQIIPSVEEEPIQLPVEPGEDVAEIISFDGNQLFTSKETAEMIRPLTNSRTMRFNGLALAAFARIVLGIGTNPDVSNRIKLTIREGGNLILHPRADNLRPNVDIRDEFKGVINDDSSDFDIQIDIFTDQYYEVQTIDLRKNDTKHVYKFPRDLDPIDNTSDYLDSGVAVALLLALYAWKVTDDDITTLQNSFAEVFDLASSYAPFNIETRALKDYAPLIRSMIIASGMRAGYLAHEYIQQVHRLRDYLDA